MLAVIVTALNERPTISRIMLNCAQRLDVRVVAACHNEADAALVYEYGGDVVLVKDNNPAAKFNAALFAAIASSENFTHFIIMGDDDSISDEVLKHGDKDFVGFADNHYVDTETGKVGLHDYRRNTPYPKPIGAGRMISRRAIYDTAYFVDCRVIREHGDIYCRFKQGDNIRMRLSVAQMLERMGFVKIIEREYIGLWPVLSKTGLDYRSDLRLIRSGFIPHIIESDKVHVTDFKSQRNIWQFGILENKMTTSTLDEATWFMSEHEREYVNTLISK